MLRLLIIGICILTYPAIGQDKNTQTYVSITGAIGNRQGSVSIDYFYNWQLLASKKLEIGIGGRFTTYFGSAKYFSSAPADLANDEKKVDSILLQSPQVNAFNLAINLGYQVVPKIGIGFNIDLVGFSFGGKKDGFYINGNQGQSIKAKPTTFNVLLIGNNDRGSLNSEFYLQYNITTSLLIKAAYQYLFIEYTTESEVQQQPEPNDRFRNKASLFSIGITKQF